MIESTAALRQGLGRGRDERLARQKASGIVPPGTDARAAQRRRAPGTALGDERRLAVRLQEAFAGMLEHADAQIGRLVD